MIESNELERRREERYAGWSEGLGSDILAGRISLEALERTRRLRRRSTPIRSEAGRSCWRTS